MELSKGEKLILVMLADIQQHLKIRGEVDPAFVKSAIFSDHLFGLEWEYSGLFNDEPTTPESVRSEVVDILDMWSFLESTHERLDAADRKKIEDAVPYYGKDVKFVGFDGNNESSHFGLAKFLVEDMGRWTEFKGRSLNSHSHSLERHRAMLRVFLPLRNTLHSGMMTADQVIAVLNANRS